MELVKPELGLIFWTALTFLLLVFLLAKFAWKPILNAVNEREKSIEGALRAAEHARDEMKSLQADNDNIKREARAERERILREAEDIKNKIISEATEKAKEESGKQIALARLQIHAEKENAIAQIKTQVAEISVEIAEKLLRKELSAENRQQQLIDNLLKEAKI